MNVFIKHYRDPQAAAAAHLAWLTNLGASIRLPALRTCAGPWLVTELLTGQQPRPADLPVAAAALGTLHRIAYDRHLHHARLDRPLHVGGLLIDDFVTPRRAALARQPVPHTGLPAAIYKDTNVRNILLTNQGVALVDFDDLTLAPFGYDLAKLIFSAAMTYGQPAPSLRADTLAAYNAHAGINACAVDHLRYYAELHGSLTAPYLHRNGYRHPWPTVRPWPAPDQEQPGTITTELVIARHGEAVCNTTGTVGGNRGCTGLTNRGGNRYTCSRTGSLPNTATGRTTPSTPRRGCGYVRAPTSSPPGSN